MTAEDKIHHYITCLKSSKTNVYSRSADSRLAFHIDDCKALASLIGSPKCIVDLGSGSGLPAIILAILKPQIPIIAIESTKRKCEFLNWVQKTVHIPNIDIRHTDVLKFSHQNKNKFTTVTAKAFCPVPKAIQFSARICHHSGYLWIPVSHRQQQLYLNLPGIESTVIVRGDQEFYYLKISPRLTEIAP